MNKKLLCSTALVGALMVSGSAFAELKIGGNVTNTINLGSDDRNEAVAGEDLVGVNSDSRIGTEMNLSLLSKKDLNNGMYMQYAGTIEFDTVQTATPDVEYEIQMGTKDFYVGVGSDSGNNISSTPTLPAVGFHIGTLAGNVSSAQPFNNEGMLANSVLANNEANDSTHLSLNANVAGGKASVVYAPSNSSANDNDGALVTAQPGGSVISYLYQGSPVENVKFIIGRNVMSAQDSGDLDGVNEDVNIDENTTDKIGLSYNFGKITAGYEYQKLTQEDQSDDPVADGKIKAHNYAVTFAASDNLTLGVQYSKTSVNEAVREVSSDEKITALSAGYNLGGASIALSLVEVENAQARDGNDFQGAVITTRMAF
jgi:hypothetical protein